MCSEVVFDDATHTYRMSGIIIPSVTGVMPKQAGHAFVSPERMAETSEDGKYRHHRIQKHFDDGRHSETPFDAGIERFISEHPEFGAFVGAEVVLWSQFRYAGTADLLFENAVVDAKRTMGAKRYHALQTAGYCNAAVERKYIAENRNHWILQIDDDGNYKAVNVWNELSKVMFLSLVKAWWEPEKYRENVDRTINNYLNM